VTERHTREWGLWYPFTFPYAMALLWWILLKGGQVCSSDIFG